MVTACLMVFALAGVAVADAESTDEGNTTLRASDYLTQCLTSISASGNNVVKVSFTVRAKDIMQNIGVLQIIIERNSGNGWVYDRTLYHEDYVTFIGHNRSVYNADIGFIGTVGYQYRATITAYAADNYGSDTGTATSGTTTCY